MDAIEHPPLVSLFHQGIPDHVLYTWVVMGVLIVLSLAASRNLQLAPRGVQNFMEMVLEQFLTALDDVVGHEGRRYLPLIGTLGLFILTSNLLGLIPGLMAPTSNLNTTAACALIVFATYHVIGIRKQGFLTYLKHFCGPVPLLAPLMFPIELVSHLARPLSLSLRLFGNMFGGHVLLAIIFLLTGLDGLIGWALTGKLAGILIGVPGGAIMIAFTVGFLLPLKILVAFLQAFIFCMLSMLYIAGAIEEAEHH
jgi:F-type H+-transporting ATPase subunit a